MPEGSAVDLDNEQESGRLNKVETNLFEILDKNGDGKVSMEELQAMIQDHHKAVTSAPHLYNLLFSQFNSGEEKRSATSVKHSIFDKLTKVKKTF